MSFDVAIILLNWNGWRDTIECLDSLRVQSHQKSRIIVVDNGSTDDSVVQIKAWASDRASVRILDYEAAEAERGGTVQGEQEIATAPFGTTLILIQAGENLGFAAGNNLAARYALAHSPDYIWLLNNDTVVMPDTLQKLVDFMTLRPEFGAVTGQTRYYGDRDRIWNCGGQLTWYGTRRYEYRDAPAMTAPKSGARKITFMTGCAPLFRARVLRDVGLLPTRFFFGEEDFELSHTMRTRGYPMACRYDALIYHKVSASANLAAKDSALGMIYVHYLCRMIDLRGHWPTPIWQLWRAIYLPYILWLAWRACRPPLLTLIRFSVSLLRESSTRLGVDRDAFQAALKDGLIQRSSARRFGPSLQAKGS